MNLNAEFGKAAENAAAEYVLSLGWRLLGRNIIINHGELDITALDNFAKELVIVEVRARTVADNQAEFGYLDSAEESVGLRKLKTLVRTGQAYADKISWGGDWRIDVIAINFYRDGRAAGLKYFRDVTGEIDLADRLADN